jgi:hypothetical protein
MATIQAHILLSWRKDYSSLLMSKRKLVTTSDSNLYKGAEVLLPYKTMLSAWPMSFVVAPNISNYGIEKFKT